VRHDPNGWVQNARVTRRFGWDEFFAGLRRIHSERPWMRAFLVFLPIASVVQLIRADTWLGRGWLAAMAALYTYVTWRVLRKEP
jgi:hypothetical protein